MIDRLWVMWRDAADSRHAIGQLWREGALYRFGYEQALPVTFNMLAEFPQHRTSEAPYESQYLFATFAERIPAPKRPDYQAILDSWGVEDRDDQLEVLARSGGIQATDWIELSEWRAENDNLVSPLLIRVAGTKHHPGAVNAKTGDDVRLAREPTNAYDTNATEIFLSASGEKLGYVPRPYTTLVARLLDSDQSITGRIERHLGLPNSYGRWVVRLERQ